MVSMPLVVPRQWGSNPPAPTPPIYLPNKKKSFLFSVDVNFADSVCLFWSGI